MDMRDVFRERPVLAIMRNVLLENTVKYAKAAVDGGVRIFEVALNSKDGYEQISILRKEFGSDAMIGAGTAITVEKAKRAVEAGADFLLTPSTQTEILDYCRCQNIPLLPGVLTPSDVAACVNYGFHTMKLFPAGEMPVSYIESLKGPFDDTDYVAIGGVNMENIDVFFQKGFVGVGLGSNIMPKAAVRDNDWQKCTSYVRQLVEKGLQGQKAYEGRKSITGQGD